MSDRQQRVFRTLAAIALLFVFVLIVVAHSAHPLGISLFCLLLLPVFLFSKIAVPQFFWSTGQTNETVLCAAPVLPSRFQRPPPHSIA